MATTTVSAPPTFNRVLIRPLGSVATAGLLALIGLAVTIQFPSATPLVALLAIGLLAIAAWMLFSERYEWSLAILMLYLGLADGYLKLRTGSSYITVVRDLLLYAIAVGALVRIAVRHQSLTLPPLSGWVIAWVVVVVVQLANPSNAGLLHSLGAIRPQAEFVPLFFLGYLVMRSKARLRRFLLLLLTIAAINGIVGLIQLNLTPEQLSAWGPGYSKFINGEGGVSGRTYVSSNGTSHVRPFALGGDFGFGGTVGMIAVPAALALLALYRRPGPRFAVALLSIGTVLAVATSDARTAVIGAVIAAFAFAALSVRSRAGLRTVVAVGIAVAVAYGTISLLSSSTSKESFRYESISNPEKAISTAYEYRRATLDKVPTYATQFPFGAGFGSAGPAATFGGTSPRGLDAESEPTYLLIELGLPGLVVMISFFLVLLYLSFAKIRKISDRETRILLTAVAAPLFAIFSTGVVGANTATVPDAPYLWLAAGVIGFWLLGGGHRALANLGLLGTPGRGPSAPQANGR
jgi:hypothetical protein